MRVELLAVGTELLLGDVVNGNAAWLGRRLAEIGVDVLRTGVVGDNVERIGAAVAEALSLADCVLMTGGLGPTPDDVTREALCAVAGVPLIRDAVLERRLRERYAAAGQADVSAANLRMADLPAGAIAFPNPRGTAPGIGLAVETRSGGGYVYALPGVPAEMEEIFTGSVRADLLLRAGEPGVIESRTLRTVGMAESEVARRLAELDAELARSGNPTLAYLASAGQTRVRLTAKAADHELAAQLLEAPAARVRALLGDVVYGADDDTLDSVVHSLLAARGATVATAESLTGGILAGALTEMAGSSLTFRGGVVAYATDLKDSLLGVPGELLAERGPVDADVVAAMADAARVRLASTYGVATTGVAGPTEQAGKAVGTVFIAVAGPEGIVVRSPRASGSRDRIRMLTASAALDLLRRVLLDLPR